MKDPITTAFVVKGAVTHPQYSAFLDVMPEGEVEAVDYLIAAAEVLETQYEKRNSDNFDHVVFAYEVAEPFGATIVEQIIDREGKLRMHVIAGLAATLLDELSAC